MPTYWHQDEGYWGRNLADKGLTCWIPLHDVDARNGCMHFTDRGHLDGVLTHRLVEGVQSDLLTCDVDESRTVVCPIKRGAVTFHHSKTPHMTNANSSERWRKAVTNHLQAIGAGGQGDHYAWRVRVNQRTASAPTRSMTGIRRFLARAAALSFLSLVALARPRAPLVRPEVTLPAGAEPISRMLSVRDSSSHSARARLRYSIEEQRVVRAGHGNRMGKWLRRRAAHASFAAARFRNGGPVTKIEKFSLQESAPAPVVLPALRSRSPTRTARRSGRALRRRNRERRNVRLFASTRSCCPMAEHARGPAAGNHLAGGQTAALFITVKPGGSCGGSGVKAGRTKAPWRARSIEGFTLVRSARRTCSTSGQRRCGAVCDVSTITGSWATLGEPKPPAPLRDRLGNGIAWMRPRPMVPARIRVRRDRAGQAAAERVDWFVIAFYLVSMLGMGLYFYLREKRNSTADFFVGGRSIPFWAAGISLYAANTSSISYIAIPAKAFETNWQYLMNNLVGVLGLMFVAVWIVPVLRRLDLMSVFSYIETRFHPAIRTLASALYIVVQIGSRMSVILFLPSLAIATMRAST